MVRARMVSHPSEWEMNGYNEIQNPPERYGVIDTAGLLSSCGFAEIGQFAEPHRQWVQDAINNSDSGNRRESCWTESIAVGSTTFVEDIKTRLGIQGIGRRIEEHQDRFVLREDYAQYNAGFDLEKACLSPENSYYWDI